MQAQTGPLPGRGVVALAAVLGSLLVVGAQDAMATATMPSVPRAAGRPQVLRAPSVSRVVRTSGKSTGAAPSEAPLPAYGVVLPPKATAPPGSGRSAVYTSRGWVTSAGDPAAARRKPLGIPRSEGSAGPIGPLPKSPTQFLGSTAVDTFPSGCSDFGVNESSIAQSSVNPNLVIDVAQGYMNASGGCDDSHAFAFYSHDGGQHWRQSSPHYTQPASGDTVVAYSEKFQKFVFGYLEFTRGTTTGRRIAAMTSTDGSSWGQEVTLAITGSGGTENVDKPMIVADNNPASPHYGRVVITYTDFRSGGQVLFDVFTDNGGASWTFGSTSINFTSSNCANGTSPAFDHNGGLMVAWWDCNGGASIREEYSADGGATWPASSDTTVSNISSIEDPSSGACALDGGGSAFRCNSFPALAGDPTTSVSGTAFIVTWPNFQATTVGGVTHNISQMFARSTANAGSSWDGSHFISFNDFGDKFFPWASFSPNGRLNIGFSNRHDNSSSGNPQGKSWNESMTEAASLAAVRANSYISYTADSTLGDPGSRAFIGDYSGITSQDNNFDTFPTWTDDRSASNNNVRTMDLCYANCFITFLSPYTPISRFPSAGSTFADLYQYNTETAFGGSGSNFWNAVGIRTNIGGGIDDDMSLFPNRYFSGALTGSAFGTSRNDYTLTNNNSGNAPDKPYFPQIRSFSTAGGPYTIEWASGHLVLGTALADSMGSSDVVHVYDSLLSTGTTYFLGLRPAGGNTSSYSLVAHQAAAGSSQGRASASSDSGPQPAGAPAFAQLSTGANAQVFDGLVVVNENGGSGSYTLYRDTAAPTGTISIDGGNAATNSTAATLSLTSSNSTAGDPVLEMRFSTDGSSFGAWQPVGASAPFTLPSGDGTKTVFVQFRNGAGAVSPSFSDTIALDTVAPKGLMNVPALMPKLASANVKWSAKDPAPSGGGPFVFDVQRQTGTTTLGAFAPFVTGTTSTSTTLTGVEGETDCFQARAKDGAGNQGGFVAAPVCTGYPIDDAHATVAGGFAHSSASSTTYFGGTKSVSTTVGATLKTASRSNVKVVGLMFDAQPGGGQVQLLMNGIVACTIDTSNASLVHKKVVMCPPFASPQTTKVVVKQTTAGTVTVDAIGARLK